MPGTPVPMSRIPTKVKTHSLLLAALLSSGLATGAAHAQRSYLDAVLDPCSKGQAAFYLEPGGKDGTGGYVAKIYAMDGVLKADGQYADEQYRVPNGHFIFYFPNGKTESEGEYVNGRKDGVWSRHDQWGRDLAEKVYDRAPLMNLVYTMAQTMPEYPGGEKAMVRYLKEKVGKAKGEVMASFIVEKDGQLSDVQIVGAKDPAVAGQLADAINTLPRWQAGMQDGHPVRVQMHVPLK